MGRTGRRSGSRRNCLFLATIDEALVRAAALIELWASGYVEPMEPPSEPYHILAQQLMALALQERGIGRRDWPRWVRNVPAFSQMASDKIDTLVSWMLDQEILWEEAGILWFGRRGEETYGRRNFLELLSVFTSPPQNGSGPIYGKPRDVEIGDCRWPGRHKLASRGPLTVPSGHTIITSAR